MEDCVDCKLVKSIGLTNFNTLQIDRILQHCRIKPVVNQIELHLTMAQQKMIRFCKERDIIVSAYCPFGINELGGMPNFPETTVVDPEVQKIAKKHRKTPAQVVLNYLVCRLLCKTISV